MLKITDLNLQLAAIRSEILAKAEEIISSCSYIHGSYVAAFEKQFAALQQANFCSGCSNGTSALFLALTALGIGQGDEVITTPHSFIATAEAISHTGASPVFVDIDPDTYTLNPGLLEAAITDKTRAIIPVHLYGMPADMTPIVAIASQYGLAIVEDCAQAHLAEYQGEKVGTFGAVGAFSFYPGKNLGGYGDAGAVVSNDEQLINRIRKLLNHGRSEKYVHEIIGYNHRMDELQAGLLQVKLRYLEQWTASRQGHAAKYSELLKTISGIKVPLVPDYAKHVFHLYVIEVAERDSVAAYLMQNGIQTGIHYPLPLHLQPAYQHLGYKLGDFPVTEHVASRIISLPLYPELKEEEIQTVCEHLRTVLDRVPANRLAV